MALVAVPAREEVLRLYEVGGLATELARYHEHDGDDDPFVAICVDLHNIGEIDLLSVVQTPLFTALPGHAFFTAQHAYCEAIPQLQTDVEPLMQCCWALITQAGNDGAAGQPNLAFQKWCSANPHEAKQAISMAKAGDDLARKFLSFALRSQRDVDTAIAITDEFDDDRRNSAINALGHMVYPDDGAARKAIATLKKFFGQDAGDVVRPNAVFAAFDILERHPDPTAAASVVEAAVVAPGAQTIHALADALWMHGKQLDGYGLALVLQALRLVPRENLGTVRIIDHGLQRLVGTPNEGLALDCLGDLLHDRGLSIKEFNSTAHELRRPHSLRLFNLIVRWLLSGKSALYRAVNDLVGVDQDGPFDIGANVPDLPPMHRVFLARKAIGYLLLKPVLCCSILVALSRSATKEEGEELAKLLFDPLLLNYGGEAKDYLSGIGEADPGYAYVQSALALDKKFYEGLDSTGEIRELHPSDHRREIVWQRAHDDMAKMRKSAESQSIFFNLVHRSTMLYGNRSLTFVEGPGGDQRAVSMDLKSFGIKFEMPRREVLDPVGLDHMLRVFRVERMK